MTTVNPQIQPQLSNKKRKEKKKSTCVAPIAYSGKRVPVTATRPTACWLTIQADSQSAPFRYLFFAVDIHKRVEADGGMLLSGCNGKPRCIIDWLVVTRGVLKLPASISNKSPVLQSVNF